MTEGYTLGDIAAVTNCGKGNDGGMWGGDFGAWIILFLIFGMFGWGNGGFGGGFGGNGGGAANPAFQGWATRADINEGFALNNLQSGITAIQQGICDSTYALNNTITNGFNASQMGVMQGFNQIGCQLAECCCNTQRAIDAVNYNMAQTSCDIKGAINGSTRDILENQNTNTRAILDFLTQSKIDTLQAENQTLRLAASQSNQNAVLMAAMDANKAEIIRRTGADCPIPAYVVPNPNCCYQYSAQQQNGCGCGSF